MLGALLLLRISGDVFPGVIRAADQRGGFDVAKAQCQRFPFQVGEFLRCHVAFHRQMILRWPQVLSEGQDIAVDSAQVAQHPDQFVVAPRPGRA